MSLSACSKWNQAGAGPEECIARISEVTDWEAGGRTELRHLERVFQKEREDGERRVLAVMRRGTRVGATGRGSIVVLRVLLYTIPTSLLCSPVQDTNQGSATVLTHLAY
jgi:hypothetical protein